MNFKFFKPQYEFMTDKSPIVAFIGGIGSGKTYTGSAWLLSQALTKPNRNFYACSNTYPQLKDSLYPKFFSWLEAFGLKEKIDYTFNKTDKDLKLSNGSLIMFRSLQNYNMIRGAEATSALLDEARDMEEEALKVILGRLRESDTAQIKITTTPAGYNWIYDMKKAGNLVVHSMKTADNTYLPRTYIENLADNYSGDFLRQELYAEFVNFAGKLVYSDFIRDKNIIEEVPETAGKTIHIGMDFNVDPFCAIVLIEHGGKLYAIDEIVLHGMAVDAMINTIKEKYDGHDIYIYPDSSGKNRTLIEMKSVIGELQKAFGMDRVQYFKANPRISARVNTVNAELKQGNLLIYYKCEKMIKDLERVKFSESGAFEIAKQSKDLTHISDALGYMVYYKKISEVAEWQQN